MPEIIPTPQGRLNYVSIWTPRADQNNRMKYSATIYIPKTENIEGLKQALMVVAQEKWPNGFPPGIHNPIKDGDTDVYVKGKNVGRLKKEIQPALAGCWVITATSNDMWPSGDKKEAPQVVDNNVNAVLDKSAVYDGIIGVLGVSCYAYQNTNGAGVGFNLALLQVVRPGERLGGAQADPSSVFAPLPGEPTGTVAPGAPAAANPFGTPAAAAPPAQAPANAFGTPAAPPAPAQAPANPFGGAQPPAQGGGFLNS